MDTLYYLSSLRSIHIITGIFWVGATLYFAWFVLPAVKASGPEGGRFMQNLSGTNRLPLVMSLVSLLNILSGIMIISKLSSGFETAWFSNRHGIIVSVGALLAVIAFLEGLLITRPNAEKLNRLTRTIATAGLPPTESQVLELAVYRNKMIMVIKQSAILLILSAVAMSLVHYL